MGKLVANFNNMASIKCMDRVYVITVSRLPAILHGGQKSWTRSVEGKNCLGFNQYGMGLSVSVQQPSGVLYGCWSEALLAKESHKL